MTLIGLLALAPAGSAHSQLTSSDPADGSTVRRAPGSITLKFNEAVDPGYVKVSVTGPERADLVEGKPAASGSQVSATIQPPTVSGKYVVAYRVLSADGHPVSGTISFDFTGGSAAGVGKPGKSGEQTVDAETGDAKAAEANAEQAKLAAQSGEQEEALPVWPWVAGAGVLVLVGAVVAYLVSREPKGH